MNEYEKARRDNGGASPRAGQPAGERTGLLRVLTLQRGGRIDATGAEDQRKVETIQDRGRTTAEDDCAPRHRPRLSRPKGRTDGAGGTPHKRHAHRSQTQAARKGAHYEQQPARDTQPEREKARSGHVDRPQRDS